MKTMYKLRASVKLKTDFFVFDVETQGLRAKSDAFIFGVVYGHNFMKVIYTVDEFKKEFLHPRYAKKKVFAHNAEYDLNVIYDNIYDLDSKAIFNGKFICATNGVCMFADSMNIYATKLSNIGAMLGLKKKKLSSHFKDATFKGKVSQKDIEYCIRDCEIVYEALFQAFEFSGQICITQASLSLAYFRRYHLPYNITHNDIQTKYFYNSYYGGRTEVFKLGRTFASVYDVNSMYPFVMRNGMYPNPRNLKRYGRTNPPTFIKRFLKDFEGCVHVRVKHKKTWLGFLPYRHDGKLIFPVGIFSGWYNFNELRFALEKKVIEILEVKEFVCSKPMLSIFKGFVDHLYKERFRTKDPFEIYRIKIYMNSLYGKLAQRIKEESFYLENILTEESQKLIEKSKLEKTFIKLQMFSMERNDAFLFVVKNGGRTLSYSIPSFSSYITSYSRIVLLKKLLECKNNKPLYCDTDSIFLEHDLQENSKVTIDVKNIPELGAWKKENKTVVNIKGLKNYEYFEHDSPNDIKRRIKGVPKTAVKIDEKTYQYTNLTKTKESLRRNIEAGVQIKRTKVLTEIYDKRIVLNKGKTKPILL